MSNSYNNFNWSTLAGPLLMFSSALSFTAHSIVIKLMGPQFSIWDMAFYRFFGGMVLLIAIFGRHKNPFKGHNKRLLVIRGCAGSITFLCLIAAIRLIPVSTAIVIFYSFPRIIEKMCEPPNCCSPLFLWMTARVVQTHFMSSLKMAK